MARNEDTPENNDNLMEELLDKVNKMELEIAELRRRIDFPFLNNFNDIDDPFDCPEGGQHDYPFPWHSITAAPCKKCGKLSYGVDTGNPPWDFNKHGGNVMNSDNPVVTHDSSKEIKTNYITDQSKLF